MALRVNPSMSIWKASWTASSGAIPGQTEFIQAVREVAEDIFEFIEGREDYHRWQILRRIAEPDRIVSLPGLLGGRQAQYPRPARLPGPEQQCDRPL